MNNHDILENKMCKELEAIEEKYKGNMEMSIEDLKKVDMLAHALKSLATYNAMKEAEEYSEGFSGTRGRNAYNGQYISRNSGSYGDGYSRGYSDAMSHSMHQMPPYYPPDRNW